jgi:class 3 adenylate cyclase
MYSRFWRAYASWVLTCGECGNPNPEGSRFCNACGSALAPDAPPVTEERKVVSVLFCDLVGFTSRSDETDPEDVSATIRPYFELLRRHIESFGGTVEKFIGDAVMAVFGAPASHEDDPERAIRAGLRILDAIEKLNEDLATDLAVRVGINTGEVVAALGARPELGEGLVAGDVVNVAARLQGGAPVGGIAVGETTYRSTREVFDYEPLDAIAAKGKPEPVPAWRPLRARARFGTDLTRRHDVALVGREAERARLARLLERTLRDRSCRLVTISGDPGVGKSRMVYELFQLVDELDQFVVWRQGRCLPYGEGIAFWALGEIVKAEAGILESDPPAQAEAKLDRVLRSLAFEPGERAWVRARLAPLVGVASASTAEREESFTAWRRFLEALAGSGGAVFVFEDLHWADPPLLEFVQRLAASAEGVPMLLVCTARPEFSERHPGWPGHRHATTLRLVSLSEGDTATLVGELLGDRRLPTEVRAPIVERAGGNPLYAEELVRMLRDRGLLVRRGESWGLVEDTTIPFAEGIHGIIAARLDSLPPDRKRLLQDASVIGRVFWAGALETMGDRDGRAVREALRDLAEKEFLREASTSSIAGEREFAFWHMLVRDAAYAQIPRRARADKHTAATRWLQDRAAGRGEHHPEALSFHWTDASMESWGSVQESSELASALHEAALAKLARRAARRRGEFLWWEFRARRRYRRSR